MADISVDTLGFASDWFRPALMPQPHCHNEVEINFVEAGSLTYLFGGTRMHVGAGQLALFWATIPHQVVQVEDASVLHWVTIPFAAFLQWRLPDMLTRRVVHGDFILGRQEKEHQRQQQLFRQWYVDLQKASSEHRTSVIVSLRRSRKRAFLLLARIPLMVSIQESRSTRRLFTASGWKRRASFQLMPSCFACSTVCIAFAVALSGGI